MSASKPSTSMLSQLSNVLPTGTFLVFQILAPLATNNGKCGHVEIVLTTVTLILLCLLCVASSFSDSCTLDNGEVHYGIVTPWGLWNPNLHRILANNPASAQASAPASSPACCFCYRGANSPASAPASPQASAPANAQASVPATTQARVPSRCFCYPGPGDKYVLEFDDFVSAAVSVMALATISLLTSPVTTCFYPNISESILKTVPILVGLVVAAICAFGNTPRNGIGFTTSTQTSLGNTPRHGIESSPRQTDHRHNNEPV